MRAILRSEEYGGFFELESRPMLMERFGITPEEVVVHDAHRPQRAGTVEIPATSQLDGPQLRDLSIDELPSVMLAEYAERKSEIDGPSVPPGERGLRTLGLLKAYADALWSHGQMPTTERIGHALLDAFESMPYAKDVGRKDFNGAGWSCAQSLVLGMDPNKFDTEFPDARPISNTNYMSMNAGMAPSMKHVDRYREALGLPAGAEAFEKKSVLGFMLGEESGHNKVGNLDERRPFATSGLNWGILLFPGDEEIAGLPRAAGVEFPIDCINTNSQAVVTIPGNGDRLIVKTADGETLRPVKEIVRAGNGTAESWRVTFENAAGEKVSPKDVTGYLYAGNGVLLGSGSANTSLNMWWWGFCDRNTAQRLYKSKHKIPDIDRGTVKVRAGEEIIEFPKSAAQNIIDADVPDLVPPPTYCGFRFDGLAQTVKLKSGEMIFGQCDGIKLTAQAGCDRLEGNNVSIYSTPERPLPSVFRIGDRTVDAATIKSITRADGSEEVTVLTSRSYNPKVKGVLHTPVDWSAATVDGEKQILMPTDGAPLVGEVVVKLPDGNTRAVPVHTIDRIEGETEDDVRISQYSAWVSEQGGLYASDGCKGVVVSNGVRWVDGIDIETRHDDERPNWAPSGELLGIEGPVERQPGDRMLWIRGHYKYSDTSSASSNYDGFVQVGRHGRILNEGFCHGAPGFGWGANGKLDWNAESTFNPHMPAELRLALLVNGVSDIESRAEGLNLPTNWRDYLVSQE